MFVESPVLEIIHGRDFVTYEIFEDLRDLRRQPRARGLEYKKTPEVEKRVEYINMTLLSEIDHNNNAEHHAHENATMTGRRRPNLSAQASCPTAAETRKDGQGVRSGRRCRG